MSFPIHFVEKQKTIVYQIQKILAPAQPHLKYTYLKVLHEER